MTPMNHLLRMKMSIYLLFMYAKLHFLPISMRDGVTRGIKQSFSGAPRSLKSNKDHILSFFFFPFSLDYVRTSISKHAILKVSGGKIKTGREITAPLWTLACYARYAQSPVPPHPIPQSKVPLKISEPQTGPHPMLPISSENSGSQSNPGLPFTLMDKQKHRSGESNNEYSWLNKMPTFLC